jgi:hypothetical protein
MNSNGTGLDPLTNDPQEDSGPAWSPDGSKIAFYSTRDGTGEIYTMNPNGQGVDRLTNDPKEDSQPAWQPLSSPPNPKPPDKPTAPKVISTSPKANAKGVAPQPPSGQPSQRR